MNTNYRSRKHRKLQIIDAIRLLNMQPVSRRPTMYGIAKVLELKPSNHLMKIIREMVEDGLLTETKVDQFPKWTTSVFQLAKKNAEGSKPVRLISINRAGKTIEQMELI